MCDISKLDLSWIELTDEQIEEYRKMLQERGDDEVAPWKKEKPTIH